MDAQAVKRLFAVVLDFMAGDFLLNAGDFYQAVDI